MNKSRVISIHEYRLKKGITEEQFEQAVEQARGKNLFHLPGLERYHFLKRIRGTRTVAYVSIWIYKNMDVWKDLWGDAKHPISNENYPQTWKVWENDILKPLLAHEPDKINYASFVEF